MSTTNQNSTHNRRQPRTGIKRIIQGLTTDGEIPSEPIFPWDTATAHLRVVAQHAALKIQVTDEHILQLAEDDALHETLEERGTYYAASRTGGDLLFEGSTEADRIHGQFLLLSGVLRDDMWAAFILGDWYMLHSTDPGERSLGVTLLRIAADGDMLPALVNLTQHWIYEEPGFDVVTAEAYLTYGLAMGASDGRSQCAEYLVHLYVYYCPELAVDEYLQAAMRVLRGDTNGIDAKTYLLEGKLLAAGAGYAQDERAALHRFLASAMYGAESLIEVGLCYLDGRGVAMDRELARDYFFESVVATADYGSAFNLGTVYNTTSKGWVDYPLAHALYRYAAELHGGEATQVQAAVQRLGDFLNTEELVQSDTYLTKIRSFDVSGIPHLEDVRPIDPAALLKANINKDELWDLWLGPATRK